MIFSPPLVQSGFRVRAKGITETFKMRESVYTAVVMGGASLALA